MHDLLFMRCLRHSSDSPLDAALQPAEASTGGPPPLVTEPQDTTDGAFSSDHEEDEVVFGRGEAEGEGGEGENGGLLLRVRRVPRESEVVRPCPHNCWTKQAKKRGKLVLKCSVCSTLWRTYPEFHEKCTSFHYGKCEKGANCEHPHVYARLPKSGGR